MPLYRDEAIVLRTHKLGEAGQTHSYHFQVFALNTRLDIDPASADRAAVINAMKGRVLAVGDLVGTYTGQ